MSVMCQLDLQCQEAQGVFETCMDRMLESGDEFQMAYAIQVLEEVTMQYTPVESWEATLQYMVWWAWEEFSIGTMRCTSN